jgi:peptide/nickel transport system permease protein
LVGEDREHVRVVAAAATSRTMNRVPSWARFIVRRLVGLAVVVAVLVVISFLIVHLIPGDPVRRILGVDADPATVATTRKALGLDAPLTTQFHRYVTQVLHGNLGTSIRTGEQVATIISQRLPTTAELAGVALALIALVSVPLGLLGGALGRDQRHTRMDATFTAGTSFVGALPEFLTATVLAFVFAVWLRILPVAGAQGLRSLVLPAIAVAAAPMALLARLIRTETLNVLTQDYVRTARSKRLPTLMLFRRHILPNVVMSAMTLGGLLFANLVGGAIVVENVFARPGIGTALVQAIQSEDYPVIQGLILLLGVIVVVANAIVDVGLAVIDPRSRDA